jgi:GT2 family glycosyltransferase
VSSPVVSVVMVAFGGSWSCVPQALEALRRNTEESYEVILVDNGGPDSRPVPDDTAVELIRNEENVGFGPASNQGAESAKADVLCLLNADAFVESDWLPAILRRLSEDRVGAVFPAKLNLDGTLQEAGAVATGEGHAYVFGDGDDPDAPEHGFARDLDFGSAACMAIRRDRFESVAGFDPAYRIAYFEDVDLCFRLREEGLRLVFEPGSRVKHARSVAADTGALADIYSANRQVFLSRWESAVEQRPTVTQLRADARLRVAVRDLHAHDRVLLLDSLRAPLRRLSATIASAHPSSRITLLTNEIDETDEHAMLAAGVEVVSGVLDETWLAERSGHYTHVMSALDERWCELRRILQATQPQALFVDAARFHEAARNEPLNVVTAKLGIA